MRQPPCLSCYLKDSENKTDVDSHMPSFTPTVAYILAYKFSLDFTE